VPGLIEQWMPQVVTAGIEFDLDESAVQKLRDFIDGLEVVPDTLLGFFLVVCARPDRSGKLEIWARAAFTKASEGQMEQCMAKLLHVVVSNNEVLFTIELIVRLFPERREAILGDLPIALDRLAERFQAAVAVICGGAG
jgi:hypothetical protein